MGLRGGLEQCLDPLKDPNVEAHLLGGPQNPIPIQASGDLGLGFRVLGIEGLSSNGRENGNYYITWGQGFRIRRRSK